MPVIPSLGTTDYTTLAIVKDRAGVPVADTDDDDTLAAAIAAASRAIDGFCGRRFWLDDVVSARVYRASGCAELKVDDIATTTGLIIATDQGGAGTFSTTWSITDYLTEPLNGIVDGIEGWPITKIVAILGRTFPTSGPRARVQITARWGWAEIPQAVRSAAAIVTADIWKRKDAPFGVAGFGEFGALRVSGNVLNQAATLLAPYRRGAMVA